MRREWAGNVENSNDVRGSEVDVSGCEDVRKKGKSKRKRKYGRNACI